MWVYIYIYINASPYDNPDNPDIAHVIFEYSYMITLGDLTTHHVIDLNSFSLLDVAKKTDFLQADCNNLEPKYSSFDLILASNLLEFLYDPALFLQTIHTRLRPGGVLCIASTYAWDTEYTPKEKWLSGFKENGENVLGLTALDNHLQVHTPIIPINTRTYICTHTYYQSYISRSVHNITPS